MERPSQPPQSAVLEQKWDYAIAIASVDEGIGYLTLDPRVSNCRRCADDDKPVTALKGAADATIPIFTVYEMLTAEPVLNVVFAQQAPEALRASPVGRSVRNEDPRALPAPSRPGGLVGFPHRAALSAAP